MLVSLLADNVWADKQKFFCFPDVERQPAPVISLYTNRDCGDGKKREIGKLIRENGIPQIVEGEKYLCILMGFCTPMTKEFHDYIEEFKDGADATDPKILTALSIQMARNVAPLSAIDSDDGLTTQHRLFRKLARQGVNANIQCVGEGKKNDKGELYVACPDFNQCNDQKSFSIASGDPFEKRDKDGKILGNPLKKRTGFETEIETGKKESP